MRRIGLATRSGNSMQQVAQEAHRRALAGSGGGIARTHDPRGVIGTWLAIGLMTAASAQTVPGTTVSIAPAPAVTMSLAADTDGYRLEGARYFYALYADRIFQGKLPPLIHAVVVVETELDAQGRVVNVQLIRVPSHAPDVAYAIKEMIESASPLPAPARTGGVKYVETWLVDKSGRFQLVALTEGQKGE